MTYSGLRGVGHCRRGWLNAMNRLRNGSTFGLSFFTHRSYLPCNSLKANG
jgi:hypothetical protein